MKERKHTKQAIVGGGIYLFASGASPQSRFDFEDSYLNTKGINSLLLISLLFFFGFAIITVLSNALLLF